MAETVPFTYVDLSALSAEEQAAAIEAKATQVQTSFDLAAGRVFHVVFFDLGAHQSGRLLIVIHHLVVDGVSWRTLLEDLQLGYQQLLCGEQLRFSPKTTSFKVWAERLAAYAEHLKLVMYAFQSTALRGYIPMMIDAIERRAIRWQEQIKLFDEPVGDGNSRAHDAGPSVRLQRVC